ncbi:c-type cytochrome [Rickettsiella grylli]|uniref:Cytochrome c5 n=1 Tax=Rickettsiella grylli TaxID=59196 RepID=A8PQE4_9COXI|nr:c-type cytochrome [Rickettsiella grylli]EDP46112.1 cytochrome c5 [Rickettsiella grylli]
MFILKIKKVSTIVFFILFFGFMRSGYADSFDSSLIALEDRIAPIGKLKIAPSKVNQSTLKVINNNRSGKIIFENKCILCHKNGIGGAPRLGNHLDWAPRIKKKFSLLLKHAMIGYRAMPPKGACLECSITDLEKAIHYMLDQL